MTGLQPATAPVSPLAPFRHRAFFWLWLGVVVASVGTWAQTVGAQWLFVDDPNAATIVTLVQTASTLPMMLLALPAGVLADAFDRRWLMFGVQVYFVGRGDAAGGADGGRVDAAGAAAGVHLRDRRRSGGAVPDLAGDDHRAGAAAELAAATRLDMVSVNVARAAGPALAGVVIARWGVPPVFALTAVTAGVLAVILLAWRRPRATDR